MSQLKNQLKEFSERKMTRRQILRKMRKLLTRIPLKTRRQIPRKTRNITTMITKQIIKVKSKNLILRKTQSMILKKIIRRKTLKQSQQLTKTSLHLQFQLQQLL